MNNQAKPGKVQGVSAVDYEHWTPDQVAAVQRATEAYVQQGVSPEDAVEQVVKDIDAGAMFGHEPLMPESEKPQLVPETAPRTEKFKKWSDDGAPVVLNSAPAEVPSAFTRLYVQEYGRGRGRLRGISILLLIGFCTLALGVWAVFHVFHTNQLVAKKLRLPLPVEVLPAAVRTTHLTVGASGTVQPDTTIVMTARDAARVIQVPVDLGNVVKKDDLLAVLDESVFVATLGSARATALHADNQLNRTEALLKQGYSSPEDMERARSDAAAAHQAVVQAEIDLNNTKITSPAVAVVLSRTVNPGENTAINEQLFQLGTIDNVMMLAEVSEDQIGFVTLGMRGEVGTNAFPGQTFVGNVVKIAADEIATTRTFGVYIRIPNKNLSLKPGMTGYARLVADRTALTVVSTALMNPVGDHATVFVVDQNNIAHLRPVRYGLRAEGFTEIKDGLQEGELVVTVGQQELRDGDRVRANPSGPWSNK